MQTSPAMNCTPSIWFFLSFILHLPLVIAYGYDDGEETAEISGTATRYCRSYVEMKEKSTKIFAYSSVNEFPHDAISSSHFNAGDRTYHSKINKFCIGAWERDEVLYDLRIYGLGLGGSIFILNYIPFSARLRSDSCSNEFMRQLAATMLFNDKRKKKSIQNFPSIRLDVNFILQWQMLLYRLCIEFFDFIVYSILLWMYCECGGNDLPL